MKIRSILFASIVVGTVAFLAGCATTVKTTQKIDSQVQASAVVKQATAMVGANVTVPSDAAEKLEHAVLEAAQKHSGGTTAVKLKMTITEWSVRDAGTRALAGAFAGSNKIGIAVDVVDSATGAVIGHYDVERKSNPGGYGMFYDQGQATIDEAAKGVIEGLYAPSN